MDTKIKRAKEQKGKREPRIFTNRHEVTKKKVQTTDFHGLHGLRIDYSHRGHRGHRVKLWGAPGGGPGGDLFFFFGFRMHQAGLSAEKKTFQGISFGVFSAAPHHFNVTTYLKYLSILMFLWLQHFPN